MVHPPAWRRYLRFWRPDPAADVDDELRTHFELRLEELRAGGVDEDTARAQAHEEFGDVEVARHALYAIGRRMERRRRRFAWWEDVAQDTRYVARRLRKQPAFTATIVLVLALGIGANATMFGVIDRLLFRPPPHVHAPEELRRVDEYVLPSPDGSSPMGGFAPEVVRALAVGLDGLADVAAIAERPPVFRAGNMSVGVADGARLVRGAVVTGSYLRLLGVRPVLGRALQPSDDTVGGAAPAAVIGHALWQREFAGSDTVIGMPIQVDGAWYTVAGVLPPDFRGVEHVAPDVWLPLGAVRDAQPARLGRSGQGADLGPLFVIVRPRPGINIALVADRASAVLAAAAEGQPSPPWRQGPPTAALQPLEPLAAGGLSPQNVQVSLLLAGVSTLLLLIACASVANLLLARGVERSREIAVRLALGVSRRRLALHLLSEGVLLALMGGCAALAVVQWGGSALQTLLLDAVGATEHPVDARVLAFTAGAALLAGLLAGMVPALQASRPSLTNALRRTIQDGGGRHTRTRSVLVGLQTALCVVLLIGTALFVRSLRQVEAIPLGFDAERIVAGRYEQIPTDYDRARVDALFGEMTERIAAISGVRSVAVGVGVPLQVGVFVPVVAEGDPRSDHATGPMIYRVTPSYFPTLDMRVLRGRALSEADRGDTQRVVVVSTSMAQEYWPSEDPIGRCLRVGADTVPCATVVGVVADVVPLNATEELVRPQFYVPLAQSTGRQSMRAIFVSVALDADPRAITTAVRGVMQSVAPELPFAEVAPLGAMLERHYRQWRLGAGLFTLFGTIALVVAAVGLYGVLAFGVAQRRHEIGVRMALGATGSRVLTLVVRQGVTVVAVGAGIGIVLAIIGAPLAADLLYRTSPHDPISFAAVLATVLAVGLMASAIPAWRASRVPPAESLRAE